ncbi:MAG: hypothetical protein JRJ12_16325 [Deltaproteobacteria bacterium]|nr:hypothetical protein [Deltaproteobacteria bacterium]
MNGFAQDRKLAGLLLIGLGLLVFVGFGTFVMQLSGEHPEKAWQTFYLNFLLWSAVAQGGFLFSVVMHLTRARWCRPLQSLAESFAAFFPISLLMFLLLFLGRHYLFPWLHHLNHGKAAWLNLPFLFSRDLLALVCLYGLGLAYLYYALRSRLDPLNTRGRLRAFVLRDHTGSAAEIEAQQKKLTVLSLFYVLAYALALTLLAFDLVMGLEPPWFSTLFGGYAFTKAFYLGLAALMIVSAICYLARGSKSGLTPAQFHDLGKLLFAFCLVWADFFYVQLIVIWYANVSEEAFYIIQRLMNAPWRSLAWTVFTVCFVLPFFILLNRRVKTRPIAMLILSLLIIAGLWLEHLLLLGPAWNPSLSRLPLSPADGLITLGFIGLMGLAITFFLEVFPELTAEKAREA